MHLSCSLEQLIWVLKPRSWALGNPHKYPIPSLSKSIVLAFMYGLNSNYPKMYKLFQKNLHHLWYKRFLRKIKSFCNLITWQIQVEMISNFNSMGRNNSKFYTQCLNACFFQWMKFPCRKRKKKDTKHCIFSTHMAKIWDQ